MKTPLKPFSVEVKRSRAIPASPADWPAVPQEAPPARGSARSEAWQRAEEFFQPPRTPPVAAPVAAPQEEKREAEAPPDAVKSAEGKATRKRIAPSSKEPAEPDKEPGAGKKAARKRRDKSAGSEALGKSTAARLDAGPEPAEKAHLPAGADLPATASFSWDDEPEETAAGGGRHAIPADILRAASKPADRWKCRLRHLRRGWVSE